MCVGGGGVGDVWVWVVSGVGVWCAGWCMVCGVYGSVWMCVREQLGQEWKGGNTSV